MTHSSAFPVSIEVTIQDHFFADTESVPEARSNRPTDRPDKTSTNQLDNRSISPITQELWQSWFHTWLGQLQAELPPHAGYELSLRLTDDSDIQLLNAQYRRKDQPTDVLAFAALEVDYPQSPEASLVPLYLGDIVISVETAQRQAAQLNHSLVQELAWLAAHALLHLLGWDHPDEESLLRMLEQQEDLLKAIGLTICTDSIQQLVQLEYRNNLSEEV